MGPPSEFTNNDTEKAPASVGAFFRNHFSRSINVYFTNQQLITLAEFKITFVFLFLNQVNKSLHGEFGFLSIIVDVLFTFRGYCVEIDPFCQLFA